MNDTITLPLTIFIVDDETPARNRLKELLADCAAQFPLQLMGEAGNGQEALDKLAETQVEVVLVDIRMPQMDGIELARHLNKLDPPRHHLHHCLRCLCHTGIRTTCHRLPAQADPVGALVRRAFACA